MTTDETRLIMSLLDAHIQITNMRLVSNINDPYFKGQRDAVENIKDVLLKTFGGEYEIREIDGGKLSTVVKFNRS